MTKVELIEEMAEKAGITKVAAKKALESLLENIKESLKKGERVTLVGFGSWTVIKRAARVGRNPKTGETIKIKAKRVVKFKQVANLTTSTNTDDTGPMKAK